MILETERLKIRVLEKTDKDFFYEMMSNPNVMLPIPQKPMNRIESDDKFSELLLQKNPNLKNIWAVTKKEENIFLGLCGFLVNNENDNEIAYRLNEKNWGLGYGTEIAKGLIEFGFQKMNSNKMTADVNVANEKSIKILEKFMTKVNEFYNENDQCFDRRYAVSKTDYFQNTEV